MRSDKVLRKILPFAFAVSVQLFPLASCGGNAERNLENAEETAADIEAAQMEGRRAAREFLNKEWKDTMRLQEKLLEANAKKWEYERAGKKRCAEGYDSAFVSTIRTVRPEMAREISMKE